MKIFDSITKKFKNKKNNYGLKKKRNSSLKIQKSITPNSKTRKLMILNIFIKESLKSLKKGISLETNSIFLEKKKFWIKNAFGILFYIFKFKKNICKNFHKCNLKKLTDFHSNILNDNIQITNKEDNKKDWENSIRNISKEKFISRYKRKFLKNNQNNFKKG